jgi:transcriptional regulator with XRE-family HTH domain
MNQEIEDKFRKNFGKMLKTHRLALKISQEELADRANLHRTYISEIERGLKTVSLLSLLRISKALNIPASELIKEIEDIC